MKKCEICGGEFKNLGAHMKAHRGKDGVQKELSKQEVKETRPQRPIDRFRTNVVQPGQVGFRRVIR